MLPNLDLKIDDKFLTVALIGAAGLFLVYSYYGSKAVEAAKTAAEAINPVNPDNIFAAGADAVVEAVTGEQDDSIGSALYRSTHDEDGKPTGWLGRALDGLIL
jgi:hypothetical protein